MDKPGSEIDDEAIGAIVDPEARAVRLRSVAKQRGTLTPAQAEMYHEAIAQLRGDNERKHGWIARRLGVSRGRITQILNLKPKTTTEVTA